MSYIQSLRFKLMLLCTVPLVSLAALFIAHSVFIAYQVRDLSGVDVEMGWIGRQWAIAFGIAFVIFYIPITLQIQKLIKPIRQLAKEADALADGDIGIEVAKNRTDEIGVLQGGFQRLVTESRAQAGLIERIAGGDLTGNYTPRGDADVVGHSLINMMQRNSETLSGVRAGTKQFAASSSQIAHASQVLAEGASEQAASVEELSAVVTEITKQTEESAKLAEQSADWSRKILANAETGSDKMRQMTEAVREISAASHDISRVIKVIDDIAFQTNILALNAAVEAARAGEHGKGFAVVADEVRSLAAKSAEAAQNTGSLISGSVEKAAFGERIAGETAESFSEIVSGIGESNRLVLEISRYAKSQSESIGQISGSVGEISQVVQQNSATAEESAAASEELSGQSQVLERLVGGFRLREE